MRKDFKLFIVILLYFAFSLPVWTFGSFFIENKGQIVDWDKNVRNDIVCYCMIPGYTVYVTNTGLSFVKVETDGEPQNYTMKYRFNLQQANEDIPISCKVTRTDLAIPGLNGTKHTLLDKEKSYFNYYLPQCKEGIINIAAYNIVEYPEILEGTTLQLTIKASKLVITINSKNRDLPEQNLYNSLSSMILEKSLSDCCLVEFAGENSLVNPKKEKTPNGQEFNDDVKWASYIGSSGRDGAYSIDTDDEDNIIIGGDMQGADFPVTEGCFQKDNAGNFDQYLLKFSKNHSLMWCTLIGGNNADLLYDIEIFSDNTIWLCGSTNSTDYPVTGNAFQKIFNYGYNKDNNDDACFGHFSENGYRNYLSYFGGHQSDMFSEIKQSPQGNLLICGHTKSYDFPTTHFAIKKCISGCYSDAVLVKFDKNYQLSYSTYWGGSISESADGMDIDNSGNIIITGVTTSSDYPVKHAFKERLGGLWDIYIAKFDPDFNLVWSTFYGGSQWEYDGNIAIDGNDCIIVHGYTDSEDLKVTPGSLQEKMAGSRDKFIVKISPEGKIMWSTFWGSKEDSTENFYVVGDVAINSNNEIAIVNCGTSSTLITSDTALQKEFKGMADMDLLFLDTDGHYLYSTYIGGSAEDIASDVVFNSVDELLLAGITTSNDIIISGDGYQSKLCGDYDSYIVHFGTPAPSPKDTCDVTGFEYFDFSNDENIVYTGKAYRNKIDIRLSEAAVNKTGAVWHKYLMPVRNGFTCEFSFKMTGGINGTSADNSLPGADGLAFVIQNSSLKEVGGSGGKIGYDPIPNSLAVEYDLFSNDKNQIENLNDPNGNHIAVMSLGKEPNSSNHYSGAELAVAKDIKEIKPDGTIYYSKIDYNIQQGVLRVYLSKTENSYGKPVLNAKNLDLSKLLNLYEGEWAYVGFTSATGSSYQNQDLLSWDFCPKPTESQQTGVNDGLLQTDSGLLLFPNPVVDFLNIQLEDKSARILMYNLLGEEVLSSSIHGNNRVDVSGLPSGCYLIRIQLDNGQCISKNFIKK